MEFSPPDAPILGYENISFPFALLAAASVAAFLVIIGEMAWALIENDCICQ